MGRRASCARAEPRIFEAFSATDFLAAITRHIPDKGAQIVRHHGWYSNKVPGVRQRVIVP